MHKKMRRERIKRPVTTLLNLFSWNCNLNTDKFYLVSTTNLHLHLAPLIRLNQPWHPSLPASLKSTILLGDFSSYVISSQMLNRVASSISNYLLSLIYPYPYVLFHLTGSLPSLLLCSKLVTQNLPQTIGQFPCYLFHQNYLRKSSTAS